MKKYLVILGALLMVAGSAFGQGTVLNQDSCDISVSPASTLLLPYFSVDPAGETTLVTITNVSDTPAVAHFTVWTNLSYPVLDFNIFLTGYDVQGISLTDVLVNGVVPNTGTPTALSPRGTRSLNNVTGNANSQDGDFGSTCDGAAGQGGNIPPGLLSNVQSALTGGGYFDCGTGEVSLATDTMVGYITIDVIDICSQDLPTEGSDYFDDQVLHDNQLIGDYIRIDGVGGVAGASPLVHIKSVPFGGPAPGTNVTTFPRTFYDRYQRDTNLNVAVVAVQDFFDLRQPLPAQFAARYIEPGGSTGFNTNFAIWRQGITNQDSSTVCGDPLLNLTTFVEIVRFDERENPTTRVGGTCQFSPCDPLTFDELPETSLVPITSTIIPADSTSADRGGWLYLNLANSAADVVTNYPGPTQAWVQVRMTAAGTFGVDFDAAYLANGCSNFQGVTHVGLGTPKIGPHRQ